MMSQNFNPFHHHPPLLCYPTKEAIRSAAILEVGPGRGDFLFELARNNPDKKIAAIEIKKKRFYKLVKRVERLNLTNVCLILGDARVALPCLFNKEQLESIYILFSDPWPKARHSKHRLFQDYFVHDLFRVLKNNGRVILAHDYEKYLNQSKDMLLGHPGFANVGEDNDSHALDIGLFKTFYALKWREAGRELNASRVQKKEISVLRELMSFYRSGAFRNWRSKDKVKMVSAAGGTRNIF